MATPQLSPGVLVREVDLTVGRAENVLDNIGAIAGPFPLGPVNEPITIETQQQFLDTFGKPMSTDRQYEYWMSANSFLSYGGILKVVRVEGSSLNNGNAGVNQASNGSLRVDNSDDYELNHSSTSEFYYSSRNPGSWANNLKVCVIDDQADQILSIGTTNPGSLGLSVGLGITAQRANITIPGDGATSQFNGSVKGIITGVTTDAINGNSTIDVKVTSRVTPDTQTFTGIGTNSTSIQAEPNNTTIFLDGTAGVTTGTILVSTNNRKGTVTGFGTTSVTLEVGIANTITVGSAVTFESLTVIPGTETQIQYQNYNPSNSFDVGDSLNIRDSTGVSTGANPQVSAKVDWYDSQTLGLENSTVFWKSLAPKPVSNQYVTSRDGGGDGIHVVIVDDAGEVTGIQGAILERFTSLSKAKDATADGDNPSRTYYKDFIALNSKFIFAGYSPANAYDTYWKTMPVATGFSTGFTANTIGEGLWGLDAQGVQFSAVGNNTYTLTGGVDYSASGGMTAGLSDLSTAYNKFENKDEVAVDFLLMGPGLTQKSESQAKANLLVSIAEKRKDCIATISPHRDDVVNVTNSGTQTTNVLGFYAPISSSSYAVFDSGYKYTFDRFNNTFRYIPSNGDVAGLMVRTAIDAYPWFSPAGVQRGVLNNAVKMAFNPSKAQRDSLYASRINSIINQRGSGIVLYGDKTGLSYASAFDRINVRRLFLTVEQALEGAANSQLFELNDANTRANFVNIVEPYLRDVQAKRGVYDFLVVCDETNNTPDLIDNNEFRADIFLKPTKSINFITLTFVATRTGVDFQEVVGSV